MKKVKDSSNVEKVDLQYLQSSKLIHNKFYSNQLKQNNIDFRKEYNKNSKFLNYSIEVKHFKYQYFLPITIELKNNQKYLNFFGHPIIILLNKKLSNKNYIDIFDYLKKLDKEHKFKEINFKIEIKKKHFQEIQKEKYFENFSHEIFVDLQDTIEKIYKKFQSNLKGLLKKEYSDIDIEVIDKDNFKKRDLTEFRNLHIKVSNRITRSIETWNIQEKKIKNGEGFIVKVSKNNEPISFCYFSISNKNVYYDVAVGLRNLYDHYKNIHHKSLWVAIQYSKSKNFKSFFVGSYFEKSKTEIDTKEKNIQMFKKRFIKPNLYYTLIGINNIPETSVILKYIKF